MNVPADTDINKLGLCPTCGEEFGPLIRDASASTDKEGKEDGRAVALVLARKCNGKESHVAIKPEVIDVPKTIDELMRSGKSRDEGVPV